MNFQLSVIIASYSSLKLQDVKKFCVYWKNDLYGNIFKILFRKYSLQHQSIVLCSNFLKFGHQWNRELFTRQKNFVWLSSCRYCADGAQNLLGPAPDNYSECSRFHQNLFTLGGVIAERVNTAKTSRKVNPIFGWSLASSRIITDRRLNPERRVWTFGRQAICRRLSEYAGTRDIMISLLGIWGYC